MRVGSIYNHEKTKKTNWNPMSRQDAFDEIFLPDSDFMWDGDNLGLKYWSEHKMRFEDIKTKPMKMLKKICGMLKIAWADSMLATTDYGKTAISNGNVDFDLKPVFNKYEDYLSEFDRFRITIACSPYQKRYGYTYDYILKFTRRELQELFLKPFLFDEKSIFGVVNYEDNVSIYEWVRWQLWNVRKHIILDDVIPEFDRFELAQSGEKCIDEYNHKEMNKSLEYIKSHDKLVLYGTGNDCLGLLKLMDDSTKEKLLYCDKKAEAHPYIFQGKNVITPIELCSVYTDYNILVTSSLYRRVIAYEFENMGVNSSRVFYNRAEFREKSK